MSCVINIERLVIPNDIIVSLTNCYRYIGKNDNYQKVLSGDLNRVVDQTIERDAYFLAQILGLDISDTRMRLIITKSSSARNKDETTLYNLKEMLTLIQKQFYTTGYQSNDILNIINYVYSHYNSIKFDYVAFDKKQLLQSQSMRNKRLIIDEINEVIEKHLHYQSYDKLILYLHYFIDFYNIQPFVSKNETASLLLLYLLLFKSEVYAFKYASFFEILFEHYEEFTNELKNASFNWKEGYSQTLGFVRIILKLINEGYEKTERITKDYEVDSNINKGDNVENTIAKMPEIFTKEEIRLIHPYVSESTINRALIKLRDEGLIKPLGKGRSAKWIKVSRGYNVD